MTVLDDVIETPVPWWPVEFRVRQACQDWEVNQALTLRRAVFCYEQGIFQGDDRDDIDDHAQLLVAMSCQCGMPDQVVGTVRIFEVEPGIWWGSRLAVHPSFRGQGPSGLKLGAHLGATLIQLAVSRAHAQGAHTFLAHVQTQNIPLFKKLNWSLQEEVVLHGRPHGQMLADLSAYPPLLDAISGIVVCAKLPVEDRT
jgi:putative N-acetyltransferase (TIGR04045 family)